jgi:magnesium transporter
MAKRKKSGIIKKVGLPPGSLVYVGPDHGESSTLQLIRYDTQNMEKSGPMEISELSGAISKSGVNWINIDGLQDVVLVENVGNLFNLDQLLLEDILNTEQRPGIEHSEHYVCLTMKTLHSLRQSEINYEQLSLVLHDNCVITFQERPGDIFDSLRERLKHPDNRLSKRGADYLFYRLIDTVVDNYFMVLDRLADQIELLEDKVFSSPDQETLREIQFLKKELIYLLRVVVPLRESLSKLVRDKPTDITESTTDHLDDVYSHSVHVLETLETYRDIVSGLVNIYMNNVSQRMNEVMKVLTIMASIFIPLSFVAGVYGMNFTNMPGLHWKWGYFIILGFMLAAGLSMVFFFRRKKWL